MRRVRAEDGDCRELISGGVGLGVEWGELTVNGSAARPGHVDVAEHGSLELKRTRDSRQSWEEKYQAQKGRGLLLLRPGASGIRPRALGFSQRLPLGALHPGWACRPWAKKEGLERLPNGWPSILWLWDWILPWAWM
jgi:hypothetical protein